MVYERRGIMQLDGEDAIIVGPDVGVGNTAQEFNAQTFEWIKFHGLADTTGKVRTIAAVSSFDAAGCDHEARRFNQDAGNLSKHIVIKVISTDLCIHKSVGVVPQGLTRSWFCQT